MVEKRQKVHGKYEKLRCTTTDAKLAQAKNFRFKAEGFIFKGGMIFQLVCTLVATWVISIMDLD